MSSSGCDNREINFSFDPGLEGRLLALGGAVILVIISTIIFLIIAVVIQ